MSIKKEINGTYSLHYTKTDIISGKTIRTTKRGFKTQKEAKEFERSLYINKSDVTFYQLFIELQNNTNQVEDSRKEKESIIENYFPILKTIKYNNLTKPYLLSLRTELDKKNLSAKRKNKILGVIKSTCRYANKYYDLEDNSKVLDNFKIEKKEHNIWSMEEYFKFENALKDTKYEDCVPFFHTIMFTGLRKGEARALTINDLKDGYLFVHSSMRKNANSLKATKTPSSNRKILLDKDTYTMLKTLQESHEKWLFGDFRPISRDRVDNAFKYGIEKAGVKKIRIHDLRHSHASYLLSKGANIVAVSKRLGHSSINMTLQVYAHLLEESEKEVVNLLNVVKS